LLPFAATRYVLRVASAAAAVLYRVRFDAIDISRLYGAMDVFLRFAASICHAWRYAKMPLQLMLSPRYIAIIYTLRHTTVIALRLPPRHATIAAVIRRLPPALTFPPPSPPFISPDARLRYRAFADDCHFQSSRCRHAADMPRLRDIDAEPYFTSLLRVADIHTTLRYYAGLIRAMLR